MASLAKIDPKGLEGREAGQSSAPRSRDFFWDSIVLFVVFAILTLTGIDVVAEFIRGSSVQCLLPENASASADYIKQICAGSLPRTEYFPVIITVHAILILAPHYIWLNMFGAKLDFFFQHVSLLVRTRDEKTGDYAKVNYIVSRQLEHAFKHSNWMYYVYLFKLAIQFAVSAVGLAVVAKYYDDYQVTFRCSGDSVGSEYWPLGSETVSCVFSSLRLLGQIRYFYYFFLSLGMACLLLAFFWCVSLHHSELGVENLAQFSFESTLPFTSYIPQLPLYSPTLCPPLWSFVHGLLSYLPYCSWTHSSDYNIQSDYDFLVVKLFRTEGGLAHILQEVHALRWLKEKNDEEYIRIRIFKRQLGDEEKKGVHTILELIGGTYVNCRTGKFARF